MRTHLRSTLVAATASALLLLPPAVAQVPPTARQVEFEDPSQPAKQKELLTRYVETVGRWAMIQRVVQAVVERNERPLSAERMAEIDRAWKAGGNPGGLAGELARNECAQVLQALLGGNPGYADAFVTDQYGALVCMTSRSSGFYHGDEEAWRRAWAGGAGASFVAAPGRDETTGLDLVKISVPVLHEGRAVGVLTVGKITGGS
jgi:hypothetical protein